MTLLVLGARSWIGYRLSEAVTLLCPDWRVIGTTRQTAVSAHGYTTVVRASTPAEFSQQLAEIRPAAVINLLRGEDSEGLAIHAAVIDACARTDALYCFASSALALDAYQGLDLTENVAANSESLYGQFKQECERMLAKRGDCRALVLRFASIHGWSPHKASRSETFLRNISLKRPISVDWGVRQNRMLDTTLGSAVVDLIRAQATGVVHIGTEDSSEEHDFLKQVAVAFGLDQTLVVRAKDRPVNLVVRPRRIWELFGDKYRCRERDTISGLLRCTEFAGFRRK